MTSTGTWTEVKSQNQKRKAKFETHSTFASKAALKGAHKLNTLAFARLAYDQVVKRKLKKYDSGEKTVCLMFYLGFGGSIEYDLGISSYPKDIKSNLRALRSQAGVPKNKKTACAEEHILIDYMRGDKYLFSVAFDAHGVKRACSNCRKLLRHYAIKDLYFDF